jgi:hypothetical protein
MSMSLPPGFRFNPTDEELIFYYLRNRAASEQCPAPVMADVDVYKFNPWDLPCKLAHPCILTDLHATPTMHDPI